MSVTRAQRDAAWPVALIVGLAIALRAAALLMNAHGSAYLHPTFDEAVYVGGAWLTTHGAVPYHDFVFVFPPGFLVVLAPIVRAADAFGGVGLAVWTARVVSVVVGGGNTYLVSRLGTRWIGRTGGLLAAALYATTAYVVDVESAVLQEPFVNLAVLLAASLWVGGPSRTARVPVLVGLLVGAAVAIKIVAGVFLIPFLLIGTFRRPLLDRIGLAVGAVIPLAVTGSAFGVVAGWNTVWQQVVVAQLSRPRDGLGLSRVQSLLPQFHDVIAFVGGERLGLAWVAVGVFGVACGAAMALGGEPGRFWGLTGGVALAVFLASPSYYVHYGAMLAPSASLVIAWGLVRVAASVIGPRGLDRRAGTVVTLIAVLVVIVLLSADTIVGFAPVQSDATVRMVEQRVPAGQCVFAVRVQWLVAANRVPTPTADGQRLLDIYGIELLSATDAGIQPRTILAARDLPAVQRTILSHSRSCRYTLMVDRRCRGRDRDMTRATQAEIAAASTKLARTKCATLYRRRRAVTSSG